MTIANNDKQIPYRCEPNPASSKTTKRDSKVRDDIVFQNRKSRLQHLKVFAVRRSRKDMFPSNVKDLEFYQNVTDSTKKKKSFKK